MSYGPPPGYRPGHPPRYGPPPAPLNAPAYVGAALFLGCGTLALVTAIVGWNGTSENVELLVALVGAAFSGEITGNLDFAISVTMSVAGTTLTFALVLLARLEFARWVLALVGALVTGYDLYAIVDLLADGGGEYVGVPLVSLLLWTAATVVVLLPHTGRAMRGHQRRLARYPAPPPGGYRPY